MSHPFGTRYYNNGEPSSQSFFDASADDKRDSHSSLVKPPFYYRDLQNIIGSGVSSSVLENLWKASSGNLEVAVNNYFDNKMDKENLVIGEVETPRPISLRRNISSASFSPDHVELPSS